MPYLYFKEALTAWDPHAWQVLFLRCSEAGGETIIRQQGKLQKRGQNKVLQGLGTRGSC